MVDRSYDESTGSTSPDQATPSRNQIFVDHAENRSQSSDKIRGLWLKWFPSPQNPFRIVSFSLISSRPFEMRLRGSMRSPPNKQARKPKTDGVAKKHSAT